MSPLKRFLGIMLLAMMPWVASVAQSAEENVTRLTLEHADGTQSHFDLADTPELTFDATKLYIKSSTTDTSVDKANLLHFHFTKGPSADMEDIAADDFVFSFNGNIVTVSGKEIDHVSIYDIKGVCLGTYRLMESTVTVDLNSMDNGMYIVAIPGRQAVKVIVKH